MIELVKSSLLGQFEAAVSMLGESLANWPDAHFQAPVHKLSFDQALFHTLFFTDLYLGESLDDQREQAFHRGHPVDFGDYEELENRSRKNHYSREFLVEYLAFCRAKLREVIAAETEVTLTAISQIPWLSMSRLEAHEYNMRHVQHHAGQLILKMRMNDFHEAGWVKSGSPGG